MVKRAMIMAAGVGSRLDPLTRLIPKPLVPITNVPTMDILLAHLAKNGIKEVIANTHYLAEQIQNRYSKNSPIDINFKFLNETDLSGTAGGVKKCQFFFNENENFLVMSADGLTEVDLKEAIKAHKDSNCIATMVTKQIDKNEVDKFGVVVTDKNNLVCEFQEKPSVNEAKSTLINTGIYIFQYKIFNYIPAGEKYDFAKNLFPKLIENNIKINTYTTNKYWSDIGSLTQYKESTNDIFDGKMHIDGLEIKSNPEYSLILGKNVKIGKNVKFIDKCVIGDNSIINDNVTIEKSIIWDNVKIAKNTKIRNSIIANDSKINANIENRIIEAKSKIDLIKIS